MVPGKLPGDVGDPKAKGLTQPGSPEPVVPACPVGTPRFSPAVTSAGECVLSAKQGPVTAFPDLTLGSW